MLLSRQMTSSSLEDSSSRVITFLPSLCLQELRLVADFDFFATLEGSFGLDGPASLKFLL